MNILTFDIEEWFHIQMDPHFNTEVNWQNYEGRIEKNMETIFNLLEENNQKATFFCLGWVARKYPHILKKIDAYGHEIGSHSDMHLIAYQQNRQEYRSDFETALKAIEDTIGKKVISYRAPAFSITDDNKWALEVMAENGVTIDCSIFPAERDYGGFKNFGKAEPCIIQYGDYEIKEFPMNSYTLLGKEFIFSGGGYFRFFPLWAIKRMIKDSPYVMTYFHPREFDVSQPMMKELPMHRKFKSYYGLKSAYRKLETIIKEFEFLDLGNAVNSIDWDQVSKIRIA